MRILTRYVLSELLKAFLVALAGMTLFLLLVGLFREAYNQGLGLQQVFQLIPYVLPEALRFSVPATILFAACSVFGRLASANEIIAVKASGISPMVLLWPTFTLAFLISLAAVWLNDTAIIWGRDGMKKVVIDSVEEVAYGRLQQQHSYSSRQFSINVKDVQGKRLIRPEITFQGDGDDPPTNISCAEASLHTDHDELTFTITCRNGVLERGGVSFSFPDTWQQVLPLDQSGGRRSPTDLPMYAIPEDEAQQRIRIQTLAQQMSATAACQMLTGDFASLAGRTMEPPAGPGHRSSPALVPAGNGTGSTLGQWLQLLVLCALGRAAGDPDAKFGSAHQLFCLLSADSDLLLPALDVRRRAGQKRRLSPVGRLAGQCDLGRRRIALHAPGLSAIAVSPELRSRSRCGSHID